MNPHNSGKGHAGLDEPTPHVRGNADWGLGNPLPHGHKWTDGWTVTEPDRQAKDKNGQTDGQSLRQTDRNGQTGGQSLR